MPPSTFQKKIDIEESIRTVCPLLLASLMVWKSQRSEGWIFNSNLLNQEIVLFLWVSSDEACFGLCPASLVKVVFLYLK